MGMRDFFDRMIEGAETAYGRMRSEVLAGLSATIRTLDQVETRVIDLPEGAPGDENRPAEEAVLAHECIGAFERLKLVIRKLHAMSSICQGGQERTARRTDNGSIAVETTMSHEVTEAQRHRALVLLLDGTAEWSGISGAWKIVRQPRDQELGTVVGEVIEALQRDGLILFETPCRFVLTISGRMAAELALTEKVAEKIA